MKETPLWVQIAVPFSILMALALIAVGWAFGVDEYRTALAITVGEICVLGVSWIVGRRISRPMQEIEAALEGSERAEISQSGPKEVRRLAHAVGRMLSDVDAKTKSMEEEKQRLVAILSRLSEGIVIVAGDGTVVMHNPAASEILGASAESSGKSRTLAQFASQHQIISLWKRCKEGKTTPDDGIQLKRGGRFIRITSTPILDLPSHCLLTVQDITEMRLADEMRKDFISNISHELRTPLASMKILADTLREGALEDRETALRFLNKMDREIEALVQMVEELLELSRIESGQVPLKIEPVPLTEVVLPPVERLHAQAERAGLELQVDLPTPTPTVLADPERFPRVVTNLVHNAIKFTGPGGRITVFAREEADEVIVGVADTGIGIPREVLPRIFERFYKSDKSRRSQGTGLGLSISKHLVQSHGGRIWAESEEGHGSTFYFTLKKATGTGGPS